MQIEFLVPVLAGVLLTFLTLKSAWNWRGGRYLCDDCRFNNDVDCQKAERPRAVTCFAYRKR